MRVIHVPFCFHPDPVGGTEVYVEALADALGALGVASVIAAPGRRDEQYRVAGLPVHRFGPGSRAGELRVLYGEGDRDAAAGFGRILDQVVPDLLHLHAFTSGASLLAARQAVARGIPFVFTYHTPTVSCARGTLLRWGREVCAGELRANTCAACALHGRGVPEPVARALGALPPAIGAGLGRAGRAGGPWTALRMSELITLRHAALRALLAEAGAVVALCDWTRELLLRNGVPGEKIMLSRHGLPHPAEASPPATRARRAGEALRIAFLGRLEPIKGPDLLVEAMARLPGAPIILDLYGVVQGSAAYGANLRQRVAGDPRVTFKEPVPNGAVAALLRGYDLLAVPSRSLETGPLVVLEAFAAGLPVLGSALGGIADLVRDGHDGLLLPPDDPAAWARALGRLAGEPRLVAQLRAGVRPPRPLALVAEEMLAIYEQLWTPAQRSL